MRNNYSLSILLLALLGFSPLLFANKLILNDIDWPPYLFPESKSHLPGLGKDVLNKCLPKNNFTIKYIKLPVKRTHLYMQSGELDISLYSFKKDREEFVVYGKVPVFTTEYGFAVRADSNIDIQKIEDLGNLTIGHLAGLSHTPEISTIIEQKRLNGQLSIGNSIDAMFAQLLSSTPRFEIMPNSKQTFYWRATSLGITDKIRVLNFTADYKDYFVTVSRNSRNISDIAVFLADVDKCIINMRDSGEYNQLLKKYHLEGLIQ
jgi:polar amino acid transport system substrate-binding protein